MIDADDAARAVVAALQAPTGTYNVTDDDPLTRDEFASIAAEAMGVKKARTLPATLAKLSGKNARFMMRSQRVRNARFKEATGWAPSHRSLREGWPVVVAETLKEI
jgi:nucleoside-diphosphate-sugar epimerase